MAAASPNECSAANALVSEGRTFDAESSDLCRERHARPGPCRRRALGPPAVSVGGLTTPTFRTVSLPRLSVTSSLAPGQKPRVAWCDQSRVPDPAAWLTDRLGPLAKCQVMPLAPPYAA